MEDLQKCHKEITEQELNERNISPTRFGSVKQVRVIATLA